MPVHFVYNNNKLSININSVSSYPQGYAAAISIKDKIENNSLVNIVDIGGYTVDCLEIASFIPNMSLLTSLNRGVNSLFEEINDKLRANIEKELSYKTIEDILKREKYTLEYSKKRVDLVTETTKSFVSKMIDNIKYKGFDLTENKTIFMGGGSVLLEKYIVDTRKVNDPIFINDIHCNAKGYKILREMTMR